MQLNNKNIKIENLESKYDQPIQLIQLNKNNELEVGPEANQVMQEIGTKCGSFGVISVVGKYRTGKSYFINQILLNRPKSFVTGSTINACTRGLWMWPQVLKITDLDSKEVKHCIVIDTEGIGNVEEGQQHDTKIFIISLLISSMLIYNSVGPIDEKALNNLNLVVKLSKHLGEQSESQIKDVINHFPSFFWVLRDFTLQLQDEFGTKITPKQYLENSLAPQKGLSEAVENKNRIRRQLSNFFKQRDCFPLVRPTLDEKDLQNLSNIDFSQLRPEFQTQANNLRNRIFNNIKPKLFNGVSVTPNIFLEMCNNFCQAVSKGTMPTIQNSWNHICKAENRRQSQLIIETAKDQILNINKETINDMSELSVIYNNLLNNYENQYDENNTLIQNTQDDKSIEQQKQIFLKEIKDIMKQQEKQIENEIQNKIENTLNQSGIQINQDIQDGNIEKLNQIIQQLEEEKHNAINQNSDSDMLKSKIYQSLYEQLKKSIEVYDLKKNNENNQIKLNLENQNQILTQQLNQIKQESHQQIIQLKHQNLEFSKQINYQIQDIKTKTQQIQLLSQKNKQQQEISEAKENYLKEYKDRIKQDFDQQVKDYQNKIQQLGDQLLQIEIDKTKNKKKQDEKDLQIYKEVQLVRQENEEIKNQVIRLNQEILHLTDILQGNSTLYNYLNMKLNNDPFMKDWLQERNHLEKSIKETKNEISQHRILHEQILESLGSMKQSIDQNNISQCQQQHWSGDQSSFLSQHYLDEKEELIQKQQKLEELINQSEQRCIDQEQMIEKLKDFYKLVKYSSSMQCKICNEYQDINDFVDHIDICQQENCSPTLKPQKINNNDVSIVKESFQETYNKIFENSIKKRKLYNMEITENINYNNLDPNYNENNLLNQKLIKINKNIGNINKSLSSEQFNHMILNCKELKQEDLPQISNKISQDKQQSQQLLNQYQQDECGENQDPVIITQKINKQQAYLRQSLDNVQEITKDIKQKFMMPQQQY